ncbi:dermatopontin [Elysia marginata]|uniref:Dermatopontin n=1 Tax=Elysia marginata TaxID=1093978 RepID=A0AAV4EKT5_9GAST|nr:dermatopontin [Elysia marginata]
MDGPLDYKCPNNGVLAGVSRELDWKTEDRPFKFRCCGQVGDTVSRCTCTDYRNYWDEEFILYVSSRHVLTGLHYVRVNYLTHRRHKSVAIPSRFVAENL